MKRWIYLSLGLFSLLLPSLIRHWSAFSNGFLTIPLVQQVAADLSNALPASAAPPLTDNLTTVAWWQQAVKQQVTASQNQQFQGCLFGDSISSMLGDTLGDRIFNFALGGMSSVSLVDQLKQLTGHNVQCQTVVIAIGTNDAWYTISDDRFMQNLELAIDLVRSLHPDRIILLPAFYSTIAASMKPDRAGPIARVDEINQLIQQVATLDQLPVAGVPDLFEQKALREDLTLDGVHLNQAGLNVYRQTLLKML
jgi:lysophospholipase L1-like esterase